jgi:hypothetical protein
MFNRKPGISGSPTSTPTTSRNLVPAMFKINLHIQKQSEVRFSPAENDSESSFRVGFCLEHWFTSISPLHKFQNILWQHTA